MTRPLVFKFGGELLDDPARLAGVVAAIGRVGREHPLVVVHGGGKEIDAALRTAGIDKRQVDGLRITDERSLDVVVAVLAGTINTRVVAALNAGGVASVGLTGADGRIGLVTAAPPHRSVNGTIVDLGCVGLPAPASDTRLIDVLLQSGFVPVIACIGSDQEGRLFNVNADTLAGALAARLGARRLVIAGTTPGVLDDAGQTVAALDVEAIDRLVRSGTATAGMIAKLRACTDALAGGVSEVVVVDGRDAAALEMAAVAPTPTMATLLTRHSTEDAARAFRPVREGV